MTTPKERGPPMLQQKMSYLLVTALIAATALIGSGCGKMAERVSGVETHDSVRVVGRSPDVTPMSIGADRWWVRNECWYSLDRNWLYRGDDPNGPGENGRKSNWNWLSTAADANSNGLRYALSTYGGYVSDLIPGYGGDLSPSEESYWAGRLSSDNYGLRYEGTNVGHGTQCVAYVTMVIYRATGGGSRLRWSWDSVNPANYPSATKAQPGDIVFYELSSTNHHVAICVRNYGTGITVVDSNYLGHEVIGRHDLNNAQIGTTWKTYSGRGLWYW